MRVLYYCVFALLITGLPGQSFAQNKTSVSDSVSTSSIDSSKSKSKQEITDTIHYESDKINYDAESKNLILIGKSMVHYQNITLNADTIIYDINNSLFTASGFPKLIEGNDTTIGDIMVYNIKTKRGRVQYASTHLDDGYFNGQRILKTDKDELYVNEGDYTTCSVVDTPHFFFYGKNIKVIPKDKIISKPVVLNIGNSPVAVLPFFIFPIERNRRSGFLTPSWGGHPNNGGYIDNIGYYYAPNDYVDFLVRSKVTEFREFVLEGASRYSLKYHLNGSINARTAFTSDFKRDYREWGIDYTHNQNITPDGLTTLTGQGSIFSKKDFIKRVSEDSAELIDQNIKANLALAHRFEKINASGNINWNRTHNLRTDNVDEDLPSINFQLPSRPIIPVRSDAPDDEARWYNKIYLSYDTRGLIKHSIDNEELKKETYHPGLYQSMSLSSPQTIFKYFTINPSVSAQASTFNGYFDTTVDHKEPIYDTVKYKIIPPSDDNRYSDYTLIKADTATVDNYGVPDSIWITKVKTRLKDVHKETTDTLITTASWKASIDLSTKVYGIVPIRIFNFAGLRHTITPRVSYSFVPEKKLNKSFYNIGIPYETGHDQKQIVGLSLENQFDGKIIKKGKEGEKDAEVKFPMLSVNMSTSYDFEAEDRKFSDLQLSASTDIKNIRLNYNSSFWLYDQNDNLSLPIMKDMEFNLSAGSIGAHGKFWDGNLLEIDSVKTTNSTSPTKGGQDWEFSFTPAYSFSMSRSNPTEMFIPEKNYSLNASARINFTPNWSLSWNGDYSFTENQWVRNSINISCDLECWDMRFQWRPERLNPGYYFVVNIKKIPEIKWEQKK